MTDSFKKLLLGSFVLLSVLGAGLPGIANAASESYNWADSSHKSVTAQGGIYQSSTTFTQSTDNGTTAEYAAKLPCVKGSGEAMATIDVKDSDITSQPQSTPGTLSVTAPSGCDYGGQPDQSITIAGGDPTTTAPASTDPSQGQYKCDQGILTWIACPIIYSLENAVVKVTQGVLVPFLHVAPLSANNTPGLYKTWSVFRDFTDFFFVIIFLGLIFGTTIGLDSYNAKRILPRLIAAAVLVQFSFFIAAMVVDFGNILGTGIGDLLFSIGGGFAGHTHMDIGNYFMSVGTILVAGVLAWAFWPMALPLLVSGLLALLALFFTLAARLLVISLLVVAGPLAIAAWILPNTESYFKRWWSTLFKLVMMYPIIIAILAIAANVNDLLGFTTGAAANGGTKILIDIIRPFVFIVAFAAIPKTFQWAGGMMAGAAGAFSALNSHGQKMLRSSRWWERQSDRRREQQWRMATSWNTKLDEVFGSSAGGRMIKAPLRGIGSLAMGGAPTEPLGNAKSLSQAKTKYAKELEELHTDVPTLQRALKAASGDRDSRAKLAQESPHMMRFINTAAGRTALVSRLDDIGALTPELVTMVRNADSGRPTGQKEFKMLKQEASKSFPKLPAMLARFDDGRLNVDLFEKQVAKLTAPKLRDDFDTQNFEIAAGYTSTDDHGNRIYGDRGQGASLEAATAIANRASRAIFEKAFRQGDANFADATKRTEIVRVIGLNRGVFQSSYNGQGVRDSIGGQLAVQASDGSYVNGDIFEELNRTANIPGFAGMDEEQRARALMSWMGMDPASIDDAIDRGLFT